MKAIHDRQREAKELYLQTIKVTNTKGLFSSLLSMYFIILVKPLLNHNS